MFDTISEFNAAIGICGFGTGFVDGGGGIVFPATGAGLNGAVAGFEAEGGGGGFAATGIGFEEAGTGFKGALLELADVVVGRGAALVCATEAPEGFEDLARSAVGGALLGYCSRRPFNILDDSGETGVLTVDFAGAGGGFGCVSAGTAEGLATTFGGVAELAMGLCIGFAAAGGFADVDALAVTDFGPAFVDFARVVVFLAASGTSTSTGSEIPFLGLPLFFTTSADILAVELSCEEIS